jgi:hypothetical protein
MSERSVLPDGFRPYRELDVCSNQLVDVPVVFAVDDQPAFLVGQGPFPLVWIAAPISRSRETWDYVVRGSEGRSSIIEIKTSMRGITTIYVGRANVLTVRATSPDTAMIADLDLRPFGLNVWGDAQTLHIGGSIFTANHFERVDTAFAIGTVSQASERPKDRLEPA